MNEKPNFKMKNKLFRYEDNNILPKKSPRKPLFKPLYRSTPNKCPQPREDVFQSDQPLPINENTPLNHNPKEKSEIFQDDLNLMDLDIDSLVTNNTDDITNEQNPHEFNHNESMMEDYPNLDLIKSEMDISKATIHENKWDEDSFFANIPITSQGDTLNKSLSFCDKIKQTLMGNAEKLFNNTIVKKNPSEIQEDYQKAILSKGLILGPFFGLPLKVKELIKEHKDIEKLYDWQEECLKLSAIENKKNLVYALPTSGGKTLVAEILMLREILCFKKNAIFVLPYVSIVQEKVRSISPFAVELDFLVEEYAAGKGVYPPKKRRKKNTIYIATIEKALNIVTGLLETNRLTEIGLIIVDELHLIGESGGRGATLEILLTQIIYHSRENLATAIPIQVVGMSATIGNLEEVANFLRADVYTRDFRPVELTEYLKHDNDLYIVKKNCASSEEKFQHYKQLNFSYSKEMLKEDPDFLSGLVLEVIPETSCLIFCSTKKNCEIVSRLLCTLLPKDFLKYKYQEKKEILSILTKESNNTICPTLEQTLPFGVAYHHSGLTQDERRVLEEAYLNGVLCCICCTTTLAAGVNLPAGRVIIREPYVGTQLISLSQYKQMAGRAGRAGLGKVGESILICPFKDLDKIRSLLCSAMDSVISHLSNNDHHGLMRLIIHSLHLGSATTNTQLKQLAGCTLLAWQNAPLNCNDRVEGMEELVNQSIANLKEQGAIRIIAEEEENANTNISISRLGKAAIKGSFDLDTAHLIYTDLIQAQSSLVLLTSLHLLYLVIPYDIINNFRFDGNAFYQAYSKLDSKDLQAARVIGINEACAIRLMRGHKIKNTATRVIYRFHLTLILYELWHETSIWQVAKKFRVPRGFIQTLMTSAASFASALVRFCQELEEFWAFKEMLSSFSQRLAHCCTIELVPLMELPAVKKGRAKQLYNAGFKSLELIAKAEPKELCKAIEHLSKRTASQIISAAQLLLLERVETLRDQAEEVLENMMKCVIE